MGAGECSAVMAEAAEGPELAEAMDCGRVFVMPETGSVLVVGHSPLGAFFRAAHVDPSPAGADPTLLDCEDVADAVEVEDACEDSDDDELERCAVFRGMYMRNSSVVMGVAPLGTPLDPLHLFWKFGGGATAVIDGECAVRLLGAGAWVGVYGLPSLFSAHLCWSL